jgi:hypothetical protein
LKGKHETANENVEIISSFLIYGPRCIYVIPIIWCDVKSMKQPMKMLNYFLPVLAVRRSVFY